VILADEFASFDGFSIGSNDLTQLTLGLTCINKSYLFEQNPAKKFNQETIHAAKDKIKVGLCGQAPSDRIRTFLVEE
jgi:pyruvate,water dikinase